MSESISSRSAFLSISDDLLKISSKCSLCVSMEVFKPLLSNRSLVKPACKCYRTPVCSITWCSTLWAYGHGKSISVQEERACPYLFRGFLCFFFFYIYLVSSFLRYYVYVGMTCQAEHTVQSARLHPVQKLVPPHDVKMQRWHPSVTLCDITLFVILAFWILAFNHV